MTSGSRRGGAISWAGEGEEGAALGNSEAGSREACLAQQPFPSSRHLPYPGISSTPTGDTSYPIPTSVRPPNLLASVPMSPFLIQCARGHLPLLNRKRTSAPNYSMPRGRQLCCSHLLLTGSESWSAKVSQRGQCSPHLPDLARPAATRAALGLHKVMRSEQ